MSTQHHLTAHALARAMLAGPPEAAGMAVRMAACLGAPAEWQLLLAERCALFPPEHWKQLRASILAQVISADPDYQQAWLSDSPPVASGYPLREPDGMHSPPPALQACKLPPWTDSAILAQGLGVPEAGLWRLTRVPARQRRNSLGDQHYRYRLLAKRTGGWRLLEVPHPYLMVLQRRLLDRLLKDVPAHPAACGYVRRRSVIDHARAHAGQAVVLKFDLQDFFATVRASRVHALFSTLGYPEVVARELTALCTCATPEPVLQRLHDGGDLSWPQRQRLREAHLPQGAPTSAPLANLCAQGLDRRLQGLADSLGARYTRYADDLVLSGPASLHAQAPRIEAWVAHIAHDEGFALNHRKTRVQQMSQRQQVCSIVVNERPNLPRVEFDRLKAILHHCVRQGPSTQNREGRSEWRAYLHGRVGWAAQLNPAKAQRLQRLFDQIDWSR